MSSWCGCTGRTTAGLTPTGSLEKAASSPSRCSWSRPPARNACRAALERAGLPLLQDRCVRKAVGDLPCPALPGSWWFQTSLPGAGGSPPGLAHSSRAVTGGFLWNSLQQMLFESHCNSQICLTGKLKNDTFSGCSSVSFQDLAFQSLPGFGTYPTAWPSENPFVSYL